MVVTLAQKKKKKKNASKAYILPQTELAILLAYEILKLETTLSRLWNVVVLKYVHKFFYTFVFMRCNSS